MEKKVDSLKGKRVLIMGLGLHGGGAGTVKFLAQRGAELTVTDLRSKKDLFPTLKVLGRLKNIRYVFGRHRKEDFQQVDLIVKNPGVKPDSLLLKIAKEKKVPVTSDIGIFFKNCPGKIIGVTGTRGKSTAAYLIWRFLREKFRGRNSPRVFLGGNIRKSVLEFLPRVKKNDLVVLELSSFQLYDLVQEKQSPAIAVFINIFPDHLNWHKNFTDYAKAKSNIFTFQKASDYLFLVKGDRLLRQLAKNAISQIVLVGRSKKMEKITDQNLGKHYRNAAALAVAVAKHYGVGGAIIKKVLKNFKGLEGRQELVAVNRGIRWINDTTSTMPEATIAALERFSTLTKNTRGRLVLIAGGQDKKLDFKNLVSAVKKYVNFLILLPGTATEKLKEQIVKRKLQKLNLWEVKSMSEAVRRAALLSEKGDFVILSPGAVSFGLFANEFDRGEKFVDAINKLAKRKILIVSR